MDAAFLAELRKLGAVLGGNCPGEFSNHVIVFDFETGKLEEKMVTGEDFASRHLGIYPIYPIKNVETILTEYVCVYIYIYFHIGNNHLGQGTYSNVTMHRKDNFF